MRRTGGEQRPSAEEILRAMERGIEERLADMELEARLHLAEIEMLKTILELHSKIERECADPEPIGFLKPGGEC